MLIQIAAACLIAGAFPTIPQPAAAPAEPPANAAADSSLAGTWSGAIKLPGVELKVQVVLATADGKWLGTIDIPMQSARGLKLQQITLDGEAVSFQIADIPGAPTFAGRRDGADRIAGDFTQGGQKFPFELARGELPKAARPQTPRPPFPYLEEQVTVTHDGITLSGTFTLPEGKGPFPAVILVSGSGPQNRDEEVFQHRPFAVWADFLSRNGIAVLRYDDRGVGESSGDHVSATTSILATDAEAWVGCLKKRPEISSVGILGHSEGGIIAPMVAARNPAVGFIILLAGPGVSGAEVLIEQNRALALSSGATQESADKIAAAAREVFEALAAGAAEAEVRAKMTELVKTQTGKQEVDADVEQAVGQAVSGLERPWFAEFIRHDPAPDLRKLTIPVLALLGERDVQVVASQNAPAIEAALKAAGNTTATVRIVPGANHLFQQCKTGGVDEYESIETTIDPAVLALVRDWIAQNAPSKP